MAERPASGNNLIESIDELITRWWAEARNHTVIETQAAACLIGVRDTWRDPELGDQIVGNRSSCRCSGSSSWIHCGSGRDGRRLRSSSIELRSPKACDILSCGDRSCCRSSSWLIPRGLIRALVAVMSPLGITWSERGRGESRCGERNKSEAVLHAEGLGWLKNV